MHHRFVEIGVVVDDDGVLAAHLADDALHMVLPGPMRGGFADDRQADPREPVKAIKRTCGERQCAPISPPPGSNWPAARQSGRLKRISISLAAMTGDCSAGFITTVLPVTSAAAVMPVRIASGKFHGAMTAATPRGS